MKQTTPQKRQKRDLKGASFGVLDRQLFGCAIRLLLLLLLLLLLSHAK